MSHYDSCELIQDLLPGYIEGGLSEMGMNIVQEHLKTCKECESIYKEMKTDSERKIIPREQMVLDGFRKIQKRTRILKGIAGLFFGLCLAMVGYVLLVWYVIGEPVSTDQIQILEVKYHEEDRSLTIHGELRSNSYRISRVVWEESEHYGGEMNVIVYSAQTLPFYQGKRDFFITIPEMEDYRVYLACPNYDQREIYNWSQDQEHFALLYSLEEKIYSQVSELEEEQDILMYSGIMELDGKKGANYSVTHLFGEDIWHQYFNGQMILHGDVKEGDFYIWISLEEPYQIFVCSYQGDYTQDTSVILDYKEALKQKEFLE